MKVRLQPPNANDVLYLIKINEFMRFVDLHDFSMRNCREIEDKYHRHWLSDGPDDTQLFHAPQFFLTNETIKFINGRHRTLLLSRHLDEVPMAFARAAISLSTDEQDTKRILDSISVRQLTEVDVLFFPDLPIEYLGYDHNIGK